MTINTSRVNQERAWLVVGALSVLIGIAVVAFLGYRSIVLTDKVEKQEAVIQSEVSARVSADEERARTSSRLNEAIDDVNVLRAQVLASGEEPAVDPLPPEDTVLTEDEARNLTLELVRAYSVDEPAVRGIVNAAVRKIETTPGPPGDSVTPQQVYDATEAVVLPWLMANPPKNGADGRGIKAVTLRDDGCTLVTTLTDGTSNELGPICGARGPAGADGKNGADALPFTIRFRFPGRGLNDYLVTCSIADNKAPTDCTTEEVPREDPKPEPTPSATNTSTARSTP